MTHLTDDEFTHGDIHVAPDGDGWLLETGEDSCRLTREDAMDLAVLFLRELGPHGRELAAGRVAE